MNRLQYIFSIIFITYTICHNQVTAQKKVFYEVTFDSNFLKNEVIHSSKKIEDHYYILTSVNRARVAKTEEEYYLKKYTLEMRFMQQVKLPFTNVRLFSFGEDKNHIKIFYSKKISRKKQQFAQQSIDLKTMNLEENELIETKKYKKINTRQISSNDSSGISYHIGYDENFNVNKLIKKVRNEDGEKRGLDSISLVDIFKDYKIGLNVFIEEGGNGDVFLLGKVRYDKNKWGGFIISFDDNLSKMNYSKHYPISSEMLMEGQSKRIRRKFTKYYNSSKGSDARTSGSVLPHCVYQPFNCYTLSNGNRYLILKSKMSYSFYSYFNGIPYPRYSTAEHGEVVFVFDKNGELLWKHFIAKNHNIENGIVRGVSDRNELLGGTYDLYNENDFYSIFNDNSENENRNGKLKSFTGSQKGNSLFLVKIDEKGTLLKSKIIDNYELKGVCEVQTAIRLNDNQVLFFVKSGRTITKKLIVTLGNGTI